MEDTRKTPKADLESKKGLFFEIGLVIALAAVFAAFQWKSYDKITVNLAQRAVDDTPEEIIPITEQKVKPPPPPPPKQVTQIKIVENDVEVEDDIDIDAEADEETAMEEYVPPVEDEEEVKEQEIFTVVESMPEFPGGMSALGRYIADKVRYPVIAQENRIQGRVYVTFVVNKQGVVENVEIRRGVDPALDKEALRVINSLPNWKPGKQRGKPANVRYTVPINFKLQ